MVHCPVLLEEVVESLALKRGMVVIDCTAGFGGHMEKIMKCIMPGGIYLAIDQDDQAIDHISRKFLPADDDIRIVHDNARYLARICSENGITKADAVLMDCGVSSLQLDNAARGFSFMHDGPLDMRMDSRQELTALEWIKNHSETEIADAIWTYGNERYSRRIAKILKKNVVEINTTKEASELIRKSVPKHYRYGKIHPATRTFQAIRMCINREVEALEEVLNQSLPYLESGGRIAIISFHSIEDRIVKRAFLKFSSEELGKRITKKPITPNQSEKELNPRSRSAKLRVFQCN